MAFLGMGRGDNPVMGMGLYGQVWDPYQMKMVEQDPFANGAPKLTGSYEKTYGTGLSNLFASPQAQSYIKSIHDSGGKDTAALDNLKKLAKQLNVNLTNGGEFAVDANGNLGVRQRDVVADYLYPAATMGTMALGGAAATNAMGLWGGAAGAGGGAAGTGSTVATLPGQIATASSPWAGTGIAGSGGLAGGVAAGGAPAGFVSGAVGSTASHAITGAGGSAAGAAGAGAKGMLGMSWKDIIGMGANAIGEGMQTAQQAKAAKEMAQVRREELAQQRNMLNLAQGPSPQLMALLGALTQPGNYTPVTYNPGQGYSGSNAYNLASILSAVSPTTDPAAQAANAAKFDAARKAAMIDPRFTLQQSDATAAAQRPRRGGGASA